MQKEIFLTEESLTEALKAVELAKEYSNGLISEKELLSELQTRTNIIDFFCSMEYIPNSNKFDKGSI